MRFVWVSDQGDVVPETDILLSWWWTRAKRVIRARELRAQP